MKKNIIEKTLYIAALCVTLGGATSAYACDTYPTTQDNSLMARYMRHEIGTEEYIDRTTGITNNRSQNNYYR